MKPICEGMGLDWPSQLRNIKTDPVLNSVMVNLTTVAEDGRAREMVCLPLDHLHGWMFKVDAGRYEGRRERSPQIWGEVF